MQQASYLEGGPLMWMLPLYLHVNKKSDDYDGQSLCYNAKRHVWTIRKLYNCLVTCKVDNMNLASKVNNHPINTSLYHKVCINITLDKGLSGNYFFLFLHKHIWSLYPLEMSQHVLLMSNYNICFCGEIRKYWYFLAEKGTLSEAMIKIIQTFYRLP